MNTSSARFILSAPDLASCPADDQPEFAFAGRSNVGKSSLLNLLVGKRDLARVSATPGHTKHLNFFDINGRWRLVDMPGYGYAKLSRKHQSMFTRAVADYLVHRPNLVCVFTLVDSSLPPQELDLEFIEFLVDHQVPFAVVFTKIDKVGAAVVEQNITAFKARLGEWTANLPEILTSSAIAHQGRTELLRIIDESLEPEHKRPHPPKTPPKRNTPW